jgi:hypothetical protein
MSDKRRGSERSREISAIKKQGRNRRGRGVPLPGLWACRTAAGLTQRELAMLVGTSQGTITSLEHMSRGAKASPSTFPFYLSSCKTAREDHQGGESSQNVDAPRGRGNRGEP